ncbi:MAG: HD domain-containing phosphohydrolase [Phycisphaeraceae bacterium]
MNHTAPSSRGAEPGPWSAQRALLILAMLLVIAAGHGLVPTSPHALHGVHVALGKLFLVPIVLTGAWLGVRGALLAAAISTLLYVPHILLAWSGQTSENLYQSADIALFWIVAALAGWLFEREHRATSRAEQAHQGTLQALASALDAREHETDCHSERVAALAVRIARLLGLPEQEVRTLEDAARLHDIGKIGVPDRILLKAGLLNQDERRLMQRHAEIGSRIVGRLPSLRRAADLVLCHHERFDGAGYPRGLKGPDIPLPARVFAVADVYDALTNDRPYRAALPHREALAMIRQETGRAFDPVVVSAFVAAVLEAGSSTPVPTLAMEARP